MAEAINSRNYRIINGYPAAVEHMKPGLFITITQTSPSKACPDLANRAIRDCLAGMQHKALMTADSAHLEGLKLHSNAQCSAATLSSVRYDHGNGRCNIANDRKKKGDGIPTIGRPGG